MWYRVFSPGEENVPPGDILEHLTALGLVVTGHFRGDDLGWTAGQVSLTAFADATPVFLERWLSAVDDIRDDLTAWAAWLETATYSEHHLDLMARAGTARQLVTIRKPIAHPDDVAIDRLCTEMCRLLAARTAGVYQIDNVGFFRPDGELLLAEY